MLVASDERYAELHRRAGAQWLTEILRGADSPLQLSSVGVEIPMSELYDGIAFGRDAEI